MLQRTSLLGITGLAPLLLLTACAEPTRDVSPWSRLLPSEGNQMLTSMTLDPQGEPAVVGTLFETLEFSTNQPNGKSNGIFLAMLSDTGKDLWGGLGTGDYAQGTSVAIAPNGDVLLLGTFFNTFSLLGEDQTLPTSDPYVHTLIARFDPRGKLLWSKRVGSGATEGTRVGLSLATNAAGDAIVGGFFQPQIDPNDDVVVPTQEGFVTSYGAAGNLLWTHTYGGQDAQITAIAVDASGAVFAAGSDFGEFDYTSPMPIVRVPSGFITKLSPYGQEVFTTRLFGTEIQQPPHVLSMTLSASGEVVFSGDFRDEIRFGGATFHAYDGLESYVAKLSGETGETRWLDPIRTSFGLSEVLAVAVGPDDSVYATGQYRGDELTFDSLTFGPTAGTAMFLVALDADGNTTDGRIFDHAGQFSAGHALAFDPAGALVLGGHFLGQIELDDQDLRSTPNGSSFVARLTLPFTSHRRE